MSRIKDAGPYLTTIKHLCDHCKNVFKLADALNEDELNKYKADLTCCSGNNSNQAGRPITIALNSIEGIAQDDVGQDTASNSSCIRYEAVLQVVWEIYENTAKRSLTWLELQKSSEVGCSLCSQAWDALCSDFEETEQSEGRSSLKSEANNESRHDSILRMEKRWPKLYTSWSWRPSPWMKPSVIESFSVTYEAEKPEKKPTSDSIIWNTLKPRIYYSLELDSVRDGMQPMLVPGAYATPKNVYKAMTTQIDSWLQQDITLRNLIAAPVDHNWYPTRLIESLDPDGDRIRVVDTKTRSNISSFAALSYRWPSGDFLKMTESSMSGLQNDEGVLTSSLSSVFQDFVRATWDLGIRHVWIDALCIVQDDSKDWESEALQMADVYSHARLTFAIDNNIDSATFPVDVLSRCIADSISRGYPRYFIDPPFINPLLNIEHLLDTGLLSTRAWCYQERMLSKRIVHVLPSTLIWEGIGHLGQKFATLRAPSTITRTERLEIGSHLPYNSENPLDVILGRVESLESGTYPKPSIGSEKIWPIWEDCVKQYTKRHLTKEEDRLVAFSAVTSKFQEFTGDTCILGCFARDLPKCLTWICREPITVSKRTCLKAETCRIPTWSWGAVKGEIGYGSPHHIDGPYDDRYCLDAAVMSLHQPLNGAELGTWQDTRAIQIYGILIPAKLVLSDSHWTKPVILNGEAMYKIFDLPYKVLDSWTEFPPSFGTLDLRLEKPDCDGYFFNPTHVDISTRRERNRVSADKFGGEQFFALIRYRGLLLRRSSRYPDVYERYGYASYDISDIAIEDVYLSKLETTSLHFQQALQRKELENGVDFLLI